MLPEWSPSLLSCSTHLDKGFCQERLEARETIPSSDLHHTIHRASRPSKFEALSLSKTPCGSRGRFGGNGNHLWEDTETQRDYTLRGTSSCKIGHGHLSRLQNAISRPSTQELRSIPQQLNFRRSSSICEPREICFLLAETSRNNVFSATCFVRTTPAFSIHFGESFEAKRALTSGPKSCKPRTQICLKRHKRLWKNLMEGRYLKYDYPNREALFDLCPKAADRPWKRVMDTRRRASEPR